MSSQVTPLIESTAQAIYEADVFLANKPKPWSDLDDFAHERYYRMARAALGVALREPVAVPA